MRKSALPGTFQALTRPCYHPTVRVGLRSVAVLTAGLPSALRSLIVISPDTSFACPQCGDSLQQSRQFPAWCPACEWGLTDGQERRAGFFRSRLDRWSARQVEALYRQVSGSSVQRPGWGVARLASYTLAICVHAFCIALIIVAVWMIAAMLNVVTAFLAMFALLLALELRPRLGSVRKLKHVKHRADAPVLFGVLDQVAAEVGARPAHAVHADASWNASYAAVGWRRCRVVTLGLPLWDTLSADQKIAVLGHEFAHGVNGDARHGTIVGTSLAALARMHSVFRPGRRDRRVNPLVSALVGLAQVLLGWMIGGLLIAQHLLLLRASQRAEYFADAAAARVASPASMASSLDAMLTGSETYSFVAGRRRFPNQKADFWTQLRSSLSAVPESEKERRRRAHARDRLQVTGSHPPTHLRIKIMQGLPSSEQLVSLSPAQEEAIRAELAGDYTRVGSQIDQAMEG